jgi:hypothetical protein
MYTLECSLLDGNIVVVNEALRIKFHRAPVSEDYDLAIPIPDLGLYHVRTSPFGTREDLFFQLKRKSY